MASNNGVATTMAQQLAKATDAAKASGNAELMAEIARLTAENVRLQALANAKVRTTFKVTDKGAISLYGLGRWPVTLYRSQWTALFDNVDGLKAFIEANAVTLDAAEAKYAEAKANAPKPDATGTIPSIDPTAKAAAALAAQVDARLALA